jgi:hypothetical protein
MPITAPSIMVGRIFMHGDKAMANDSVEQQAPFLNAWRIAGWSIPVILLITPAVAMRYTSEVDWGPADFVIMGAMFATIGLGIEFLVRQSRSTAYRVGSVAALVTAFLTVWTTIVRDDGTGIGYFMIIMAAVVGAFSAWFRPGGMARTMLGVAIMQLLLGVAIATAPSTAGALGGPFKILLFNGFFAALWLISAGFFRVASIRDRKAAAAD